MTVITRLGWCHRGGVAWGVGRKPEEDMKNVRQPQNLMGNMNTTDRCSLKCLRIVQPLRVNRAGLWELLGIPRSP